MRKTKVLLACGLVAVMMLILCSCSSDVREVHLEGPGVVFTPVVHMWFWLWRDFTPMFWGSLNTMWELPTILAICVAPLAYLLAAVLYIVVLAVIHAVLVVVALLATLVYFFWAMGQGIFGG